MSATVAETASVPPGNGAGDEIPNKFLLVRLALQRARQLQNGARPRVDGEGHKFLWIAQQEVIAGMVSWGVTEEVGRADTR